MILLKSIYFYYIDIAFRLIDLYQTDTLLSSVVGLTFYFLSLYSFSSVCILLLLCPLFLSFFYFFLCIYFILSLIFCLSGTFFLSLSLSILRLNFSLFIIFRRVRKFAKSD